MLLNSEAGLGTQGPDDGPAGAPAAASSVEAGAAAGAAFGQLSASFRQVCADT